MKRRDFLWVGLAAAVAACQRQDATAPAPQGADGSAGVADPATVILPLYERYKTNPAVTTFPALPEQAPWSSGLRAEIEAMMVRSQATQEPILDFDPFVNAQDWQIGAVAVTTDGVVENSHATVRAHFVNGDREDEVVYDLIWEGGGWRVDNIRHEGWDLRQIVRQGA
jgi:hypothetical protein